MLNKLLKRCMPWMDKGRWYHVRINEDGSTIMDEIFDHVEIPDGNTPIKIYFKSGTDYIMLDAKAILSKTPSGVVPDPIVIDGSHPVSGIQITTTATYAIVLPKAPGTGVDYWFFMEPLSR